MVGNAFLLQLTRKSLLTEMLYLLLLPCSDDCEKTFWVCLLQALMCYITTSKFLLYNIAFIVLSQWWSSICTLCYFPLALKIVIHHSPKHMVLQFDSVYQWCLLFCKCHGFCFINIALSLCIFHAHHTVWLHREFRWYYFLILFSFTNTSSTRLTVLKNKALSQASLLQKEGQALKVHRGQAWWGKAQESWSSDS